MQHDARTMELNTDVVEWCPAPQHRRCLAVGTYQLDESSGQRQGRLHLYTLSPAWKLQPAAALDLPGIFDLRWHPTHPTPLLAAALADGSVRLLSLTEDEAGGGSSCWAAAAATDPQPDALAVSLDYARCRGLEASTLAVSYSDGSLQQLQVCGLVFTDAAFSLGWGAVPWLFQGLSWVAAQHTGRVQHRARLQHGGQGRAEGRVLVRVLETPAVKGCCACYPWTWCNWGIRGLHSVGQRPRPCCHVLLLFTSFTFQLTHSGS